MEWGKVFSVKGTVGGKLEGALERKGVKVALAEGLRKMRAVGRQA